MLNLSRRIGEKISIGGDVEVVVLSVSRGRVRLGIVAPRELPVYRSELIASIEAENRRAMASERPVATDLGGNVFDPPKEARLHFAQGIFGLADHHEFVICDLEKSNWVKALVSCVDPTVQLWIVDAPQVWEEYPVDQARRVAGFNDEEVAVAVVMNAPRNAPATVNLKAPIVLGLESRTGVQVVLDRPELGMCHRLVDLDAAAGEIEPVAAGGAS
ncbi:MAG: carbon storage regulator [Myxococcota bacterium]